MVTSFHCRPRTAFRSRRSYSELNYEDGEPSGAVEFIDEIPKSLSGKILRRGLMEGDQQAAGSPPD